MLSEKYAKYYKSKPVADFTKLYPELTAQSYHIWGKEWDSDYRMDWFCVTEPFLMINDPHTHEFDQFLAFQNADATRVNDFDAEVWLHVGPEGEQEKIVITETCFVHVPAGMVHTPLEFVKINKPIVFMDIALTAKYVRKPEDPDKPIMTEGEE
ncbi:MAG: hypothetical protein MUO19_02885 [Dehalococcoidales bacterium]|nr:hypothetical protein [Dehalococcoidales bacterium]